MSGPGVVAVCCTHFPQLLVWERKEKSELKIVDKKDQKDIWPSAQEWRNRTLVGKEQLMCSKTCFTKTK